MPSARCWRPCFSVAPPILRNFSALLRISHTENRTAHLSQGGIHHVRACFWPAGRVACFEPRAGTRVAGQHEPWRPRSAAATDPAPPPSSSASHSCAAEHVQDQGADVQAKLADQVAKVQVSQTFVNTGSQQMEVCVRLPAALRRGDRPADAAGRRQGVRRQAARRQDEARRDLRRDRPQEPRSGPAGMDRARACSRPASFRCRRAPSARSRCATRNSAARTRG